MNGILASVAESPLFSATVAPYLLLNRDLTIRSANEAYLDVTGRVLDQLVGRYVFDAFPDNPNDPTADGVRNLAASLESVLRSGQRSSMRIQRYDVSAANGEFTLKYWSPINSPIRDNDGRVAGVLHHVEDVTAVWMLAVNRDDLTLAADAPNPSDLLRASAAILSRNEQAYARLATEVTQLRQALDSRVVIEQAKGIIMAQRHCDPEHAFEILRATSRNANTNIHDLAQEIIGSTYRSD